MTLNIFTPFMLAVVFAFWGLVDELNGINPRDQVLAALVFGTWAVIRAK